MTQQTLRLVPLVSAAIAVTAIATPVFFSAPVAACPGSYYSGRRDADQRPTDSQTFFENNDPMGRSVDSSPQGIVPRNDLPDRSDWAIAASFMTFIGITIAGVVYHERQKAMLNSSLLTHPGVEHPEVHLIDLPKEALLTPTTNAIG
jgi:hypothetical protein